MRGTLVLVPLAIAILSATHLLKLPIKSANLPMQRTETEWSQLVTVIANPDLHSAVAFCLIGLLLTLNLILRFPSFGAVIEQCNQL